MTGGESRPPIDWKRTLIEGLVIVVSILLAFTIDAWWDQRREARDAQDQVARVVAELRANAEILRGKEKHLDQATQAARAFLSMMGPDAEPVSIQEIGTMISRVLGVETLSLDSSATQNFLSSGQLTDGRWIDIRLALTEMSSAVQVEVDNSLELRRMRPGFLARLQTFVSGLDVIKEHPLMTDYPPSRFTYETSVLLSDMTFEGLVANYAIRMEINRSNLDALLETHAALIGMIENSR